MLHVCGSTRPTPRLDWGRTAVLHTPVPWIRTVEPSAATGLLKIIYDAAVARAGKVYNVVRLQSLRPKVLQASTHLYVELMHAPEGSLDRIRRELIAVVVSRTN